MWRFALLSALLVMTAGCFHRQTTTVTARLHAANFGCAPTDVLVEQVEYSGWQNRGTFVATGCGVRQTYLCASNRCAASGSPVTQGWSPLGPGATPPSSGCNPPCSPGYECQGNVCRGVCNPICSPGFFCADDRQCHPQ